MSILKKIQDIFSFIAAGIVTITVGFFMLRGTMRMWDKKESSLKLSFNGLGNSLNAKRWDFLMRYTNSTFNSKEFLALWPNADFEKIE